MTRNPMDELARVLSGQDPDAVLRRWTLEREYWTFPQQPSNITGRLRVLLRDQARQIERLQTAVRVLAELAIQAGVVDCDVLVARVAAQVEDAESAMAAAGAPAAVPPEPDLDVPVACVACGTKVPRASSYLTGNGPVCAACWAGNH